MRVHYAEALLQVVDGTENSLRISGRTDGEITQEIGSVLKGLPIEIQDQYNTFAAPQDQTIDYASEPIVYMPNEFEFLLDIEAVDRLGREMLIRMTPLYVQTWEIRHQSITELWIGGRDKVLPPSERPKLTEAIREVWTLPVRGKVFVLDAESLTEPFLAAGIRDAIRVSGGLIQERVSSSCDYFATDRSDAAALALKSGARRIVNTLELRLMTGSRD